MYSVDSPTLTHEFTSKKNIKIFRKLMIIFLVVDGSAQRCQPYITIVYTAPMPTAYISLKLCFAFVLQLVDKPNKSTV